MIHPSYPKWPNSHSLVLALDAFPDRLINLGKLSREKPRHVLPVPTGVVGGAPRWRPLTRWLWQANNTRGEKRENKKSNNKFATVWQARESCERASSGSDIRRQQRKGFMTLAVQTPRNSTHKNKLRGGKNHVLCAGLGWWRDITKTGKTGECRAPLNCNKPCNPSLCCGKIMPVQQSWKDYIGKTSALVKILNGA